MLSAKSEFHDGLVTPIVTISCKLARAASGIAFPLASLPMCNSFHMETVLTTAND